MSDQVENGLGKGDDTTLLGVFTNKVSNLWAENRVLRFIGIISFLTSSILAVSVFNLKDRVTTIIVPFGMEVEGAYFVGNKPSEKYLLSISRMIINLSGNYTSSGLEFQLDELLKVIHPSKFNQYRDLFRAQVQQISEFREVTHSTHIRYEADIMMGDGEIRVPVKRTRFTGLTKSTDIGIVQISYVIEEGRFWLLDLGFEQQGELKNDRVGE